MAQNECQKYANTEHLYSQLRSSVSRFWDAMASLERLSVFLNTAEASDYPDIDATTLTAMGQLRTAVNNHESATETLALKNKIKEFIQIM